MKNYSKRGECPNLLEILHSRVIGAYLRTQDVALIEQVTRQRVSQWCIDGTIYPAFLISHQWRISPDYILTAYRKLGRPFGSRNTKPYPKGVKRPRKAKAAAASAEGIERPPVDQSDDSASQ